MSEVRVRAARGAIHVDEDSSDEVLSATERLLTQMLERNEVAADDIVSVFFTVTDDLRSAFPAEAARRMGLGRVPLLCAREIPVEGSMRAGDPGPAAVPHGARARRGQARLPRRRGDAAR